MDERLEWVWARWCARRVLHLWEAPEVVLVWLDTGDKALRGEARAAAWEAWAASEAKAATSAASAAIAAAARGACAEAAHAAWAAAEAAAKAAEAAERAAQKHARTLIDTLSVLLPEHGLSALRLDEAQEDRWLTREVWRALNLQDLAVVCDWAEVTR